MKKQVILPLLLACIAALFVTAVAEAKPRKPPKLDWRSRDRPFPFGWCPLTFTPSNLPEFTAQGASATLRFVVDRRPGQRIDNVYVAEKSVFLENLATDTICDNGLTFDPFNAPVVFLETFDSEANGWRPYLTSWNKDDQGNGALAFEPTGLVAIVISGLKKGKTYVVGAEWYTDVDNTEGAILNIKVDPSGQLGCGPDKASVGAGELFSVDE